MSSLTPQYYTNIEGGYWLTWPGGSVDRWDLERLRAWPQVGDTLIINGRFVHSLAFGEVWHGFGFYPRWDVINGWTTPLDAIEVTLGLSRQYLLPATFATNH